MYSLNAKCAAQVGKCVLRKTLHLRKGGKQWRVKMLSMHGIVGQQMKARLKDRSLDYDTGRARLTFEIYGVLPEIPTGDLDIKIKKWREARSKDANAYYWALVNQIAGVIGATKDEIHAENVQKYGYFDDPPIVVTVPAKTDMGKIEGYWKLYKDNGQFKAYLRIRGTHEYDTAEFSRFLDHVIEDCKELGIETETPDELARMEGYIR